MPWVLKKGEKGQTCVYKQGADGQATGDPLGCHASEAEAKRQLAALYANEPSAKAVKFAGQSEDVIEGLGMPWGGNLNGRDVQGEYFSPKTNFAFEWYPERPLIFQHGMDQPGLEVVGRVKSWEVKEDLGVWVKCQLEKKSRYFEAIKKLIAQQALFFSSGAMGHLAKVEKSGEIKTWPWVELTLTPTPANTLATLDFATAKAHYKSAGLELPALPPEAVASEMPPEPELPAVKALDADALKALAGSYEDLLAKLNAAINPHNPFTSGIDPDRYAFVQGTFPDHFIAELRQLGETKTYRVEYSLDADGNPTLGKMTEVEQTYKPLAKSAGLMPERLAEHTELVSAYAAALAQRTKDLSERRLKEGRVLSTATRRRLSDCLTAMRGACDEMATFLDQTDPAKAEAKAEFGRLAVDIDLLELEAALTA